MIIIRAKGHWFIHFHRTKQNGQVTRAAFDTHFHFKLQVNGVWAKNEIKWSVQLRPVRFIFSSSDKQTNGWDGAPSLLVGRLVCSPH